MTEAAAISVTNIDSVAGPVVATAAAGRAGPRADPRGLFQLLREVRAGNRSGQLHLTSARWRRTLGFLNGRVVHGTSDLAGEHLGDLLLARGLLSQADLDRAVEVVLAERKRLGAVLVERGLLERQWLEQAIGLHAQHVFSRALEGDELSHSFEELSADLLETDVSCALEPGQLILEATRSFDREQVARVLGDVERVLRPSADPLLRGQKIALTPAEGFVLSRVDGTTSARAVVELIPLPTPDTQRSLCGLLCSGVVEYAGGTGGKPAAPEPRRAPAPAPPAEPIAAPSVAAPTTAEQAPAENPAPQDVEQIRRLILDTHARVGMDHFEVLGLERMATENEVKETYAYLARILHPDASLDKSLDDLIEIRQETFIRVSLASATLRNPAARARYEQAYQPRSFRAPKAPARVPLASKARTSAPPPTPVASPALAPPAPAAPAPVPETASIVDSLPPQSSKAQPAAPASPTPGAPSPAAAPSPPGPSSPQQANATTSIDPRLAPEHVLTVARGLYDGEKYWDAIQQLEPLVGHAGEPLRTDARMLLAHAYLKNPLWTRRAEGVLQNVLAAEPAHVPALMLLAEIYASSGLPSRAAATYRKVLALVPEDIQAFEKLSALKVGPPPPAAAGGIRRLFRSR